jgi:hypothetical protein
MIEIPVSEFLDAITNHAEQLRDSVQAYMKEPK